MRGFPEFVKRHSLLLGFITALVPMVALLGLQFTWLTRLQQISERSQQTALQNYLVGVGSQVEAFYRNSAERLLNLSASTFKQRSVDSTTPLWQPRRVDGVRRLFVVDFTRTRSGAVHVYDTTGNTNESAPSLGEALAISMASSPWTVGGASGPRTSGLSVDERDPRFRMILNPITDDSAHVVGVAGMVLDEAYFREKLLPDAILQALPDYFPDEARNDMVVQVRDARHDLVMSSRRVESPGPPVTRNFSFVFTDWTLNLHTGQASPQRWARATLYSNMALALLVTLLLLGGVTLALRAAERAMRLSEMKSDFVSNVSHELRTPVASIRMFAEFLRLGRAPTPEKVREYGDHIEAESRRLSGLIESILDFSHIESGRRSYRMTPTDLPALVRETADLFEVRLRESGFRLQLDISAPPPPLMQIDPEAMRQALSNLIDNAVKYSGDARDVVVRLATPPGEVTLAVRDAGIGIPPREQKKIFERFHRVGSSLVHDVKGSGLGLAIVHHVVQAHQGRVTVDSSPGRGSTFTIHLPTPGAVAEGRLTMATPPRLAPDRAAGSGRK